MGQFIYPKRGVPMRFENDYAHGAALHVGPTLIIAFGGMGMVGKNEVWGADFFSKKGFSYLSFCPKKAHWYPEDSVNIPAEIWDFAKRYPCRITYGFSMGGHAALKFAKYFAANTAVAFVPQYSVNPVVIRDHRYNKYWGPDTGTHELLNERYATERYVFVDPDYKLDMQHVDRIAAANPLTLVACPGSQHNPLGALRERGLSGALLDIFEGTFNLNAFARKYTAMA